MKKIYMLILLAVIILNISQKANATTTLFIGGTINGKETIIDNDTPGYYSGEIPCFVMNFTYIGKIEASIDLYKGKSKFYWPSAMELGIAKIGYPIVDEKRGLIFVTAGFLSYRREQISEAEGFMLGTDLISIVGDNLYMGMDFQYSLFGASYRRFYPSNNSFSLDQLSLKLKIQYIITDHLGAVLNIHWLQFNANQGLVTEEVFIPSLGLIYRF